MRTLFLVPLLLALASPPATAQRSYPAGDVQSKGVGALTLTRAVPATVGAAGYSIAVKAGPGAAGRAGTATAAAGYVDGTGAMGVTDGDGFLVQDAGTRKLYLYANEGLTFTPPANTGTIHWQRIPFGGGPGQAVCDAITAGAWLAGSVAVTGGGNRCTYTDTVTATAAAGNVAILKGNMATCAGTLPCLAISDAAWSVSGKSGGVNGTVPASGGAAADLSLDASAGGAANGGPGAGLDGRLLLGTDAHTRAIVLGRPGQTVTVSGTLSTPILSIFAFAGSLSAPNPGPGASARYFADGATDTAMWGFPLSTASTIQNLRVFPVSNAMASSSTCTVRKNDADTTITVTIGAGSTTVVADTTHTVTFAVGDKLDLYCANASDSAGHAIRLAATLERTN